MRLLFVTPCLLLLATAGTTKITDFPALLRQQPIWLQSNIKWERAPRGVDPKLSSAAATVLYFAESGEFDMFSGTIYKRGDEVSLSVGDSESLYRGHWELKEKVLHVSFRLFYADIRFDGQKLPGPPKEANFTLGKDLRSLLVRDSTGLKLDGYKYQVRENLSRASVEDQLIAPLSHIKGEN